MFNVSKRATGVVTRGSSTTLQTRLFSSTEPKMSTLEWLKITMTPWVWDRAYLNPSKLPVPV